LRATAPVGLPEALALARASGLSVPRRVRIFGIEIDVAQQIGSPPSPPILASLPRVVAEVRRAARAWGYPVSLSTDVEVAPHA
jgi:hypothetical protein